MRMRKKNTYFSIIQLKLLEGLAEVTGITVAEHIRRAVDLYLKEQNVSISQNRTKTY